MGIDHIQENLNSGEISPLVRGHIDLEKYRAGVALALNAVCLSHGPIQNRSGTEFIAEVKDSTKKVRLIPFQYSIDQANILECGENYMRVYGSGARLETQNMVINGEMEEDKHWYIFGSTSLNERSVEQSYSGTYSRKFTTTGADDGITTSLDNDAGFALANGVTYNGTLFVYPATVTSVRVEVWDSTVGDFYAHDHTGLTAGQWNEITFTFDAASDSTTAHFRVVSTAAAGVDTFYVDSVNLEKQSTLEMVTTYSEDDVAAIDYAQSADEVYLAHTSHLPRLVFRYGANAWFFDYYDFAVSIRNSDYSWTASGGGEYYLRTASNQNPVINEPFSVSLGLLPPEQPYDVAYGGGSYDGRAPLTRGTKGSLSPNEWDYGDATGALGYNTIIVRLAAGADPDTLDTDTLWANLMPSEWAVGKGPGTVWFNDDRLIWGGSVKYPQNIWLSTASIYNDHTTQDTVADSDALNLRLGDGQVSTVLFIRALNNLIAQTPSNEWIMGGADGSSILTANSKRAKIGSSSGSARVRPIMLNNSIIHCLRHAKSLKELIYDYNSDSLVGVELSDFAEHLTRNYGIVEMAFQKTPYKILWALRSDGLLLGMTYYPQHKVFGWHRHQIGGDGIVESIAVIPGDSVDELWMVVRRGLQASNTISSIDDIDDGGTALNSWFDGNYIHLANGADGLRAYTFDGVTLTNVGHIDDGGTATAIWGDGTYLYLANGTDGVRVYTFDGANYSNVGHQTIAGAGACTGISGGTVSGTTYIFFRSSNGNSFSAYTFDGADFTETGTPDKEDVYNTFYWNGEYLFVSFGLGVAAYSFDGTFTFLDFVSGGDLSVSIWADSTHVFAAYTAESPEDAGIRAYAFDGTFTAAGSLVFGGALGIWGDGDYIYVADYDNGLIVYTYDGESFTEFATVDDGDLAYGVTGDGTYVYLSNNTGGLWAYQITSSQTKRYVERMHPYYVRPDNPYDYFLDDDTTDAIFVDSSVTVDNRQDVESVTWSNPAVFKITGHGYSNGDTVRARSFVGLDDGDVTSLVNGLDFTIANKTADTFELQTGGQSISTLIYNKYKSGGTIAKKVTAITGLSHLNNSSVVALGDGKYNGTYTVESGAITLSTAASVVHVGLAYTSEIRTLPPIVNTKAGSLMDETKRVSNVALKVFETDGIEVGPDEDSLIPVPFDTDSVPTGCADRLFDGLTKDIAVDSRHSKEPTILIRQSKPLPMTVSAIIKQLEV